MLKIKFFYLFNSYNQSFKYCIFAFLIYCNKCFDVFNETMYVILLQYLNNNIVKI